MTELWDLARYVESSPDDYQARWRLVKKLYKAWEYRQALGHLEVLKREWDQKLNVLRYLAATYYRLGRYDEAIAELQGALEVWPNEIPVREQLAKALESARRQEEALEVWQEVLKLDPQHSIAGAAIERLERGEVRARANGLELALPDLGSQPAPARVCPNCGAENQPDAGRCWRCHALLPASLPDLQERRPGESAHSRTMSVLLLLVVLGFFAAASVLTGIHVYTLVRAEPTELLPYQRVYDLLATGCIVSRTALGAGLVLLWPLAFLAALRLTGAPGIPMSTVNGAGVMLALFTYVFSFLPLALAQYLPLLVFLASIITVFVWFSLSVGRAIAVWAIQAVLVTLAVAGGVAALEGVSALRGVPEAVRYGVQFDRAETPGVFEAPPFQAPGALDVVWESTGSPWLDSRGRDVALVVRKDNLDAPLVVELQDQEGTTLRYVDLEPEPLRLSTKAAPGEPYRVFVGSELQQPVTSPAWVSSLGLLRPKFTRARSEPLF